MLFCDIGGDYAASRAAVGEVTVRQVRFHRSTNGERALVPTGACRPHLTAHYRVLPLHAAIVNSEPPGRGLSPVIPKHVFWLLDTSVLI